MQVVETTDRAAVGALITMPEFVDVIVPRGGKSLIERVSRDAKVPVIKHLDGVCHVYIDISAVIITARKRCFAPSAAASRTDAVFIFARSRRLQFCRRHHHRPPSLAGFFQGVGRARLRRIFPTSNCGRARHLGSHRGAAQQIPRQ